MTLRVLHLSDLHFGTERKDIVAHLQVAIQDLNPGLVILSGDFTQIASAKEFKKAHDFIESLKRPVLCVPGNHDIPRYNILERFFSPYRKYKKFITPNLSPYYADDNLIIVGFNTARRILPHWNWANGAFSKAQRVQLESVFTGVRDRYRVCVMHHPLHKAENSPLDVTVFGVRKAMQDIHALGIDLVLTGHVHYASITTIEQTVFASASTAISHRVREQGNGFNIVDFHDEFFEITHFFYKDNKFIPGEAKRHTKNR